MGFPDNILTSDEEVVLHLHPHWIRLAGPAAAFVVLLGLTLFGVLAVPAGSFQHAAQWLAITAAAVLLFFASLRPWLRWITTNYVVTTERVVIREGILSRHGRDIPLLRLNDISFDHSFWERLVGSGTLTIESGGERGRIVLANLPHVEEVYGTLYRLAEENAIRLRGPADDGGYSR
ncbi:PH domain-containing protein [Protofrankia symbiont of Coriaria ruscifolia]|uniref:PH domain-containing protein n=1 Tax=Protofrankia symbiont of Coriaria ruscifolia TaxID=1306542 RepID=UPI001041581A|nr:PH domain-containing protein [Protofrankia symbiont of Coriaria ruscifolia]